MRGTQPASAGPENGGRGHEPRNVGSLQNLEKARKPILPSETPEGTSPADTLALVRETHVRLLNYRQ